MSHFIHTQTEIWVATGVPPDLIESLFKKQATLTTSGARVDFV